MSRRNELYHYGVIGMKWGIRRYQNRDGTLTDAGRKRYLTSDGKLNERGKKSIKKSLAKGEAYNNPVLKTMAHNYLEDADFMTTMTKRRNEAIDKFINNKKLVEECAKKYVTSDSNEEYAFFQEMLHLNDKDDTEFKKWSGKHSYEYNSNDETYRRLSDYIDRDEWGYPVDNKAALKKYIDNETYYFTKGGGAADLYGLYYARHNPKARELERWYNYSVQKFNESYDEVKNWIIKEFGKDFVSEKMSEKEFEYLVGKTTFRLPTYIPRY